MIEAIPGAVRPLMVHTLDSGEHDCGGYLYIGFIFVKIKVFEVVCLMYAMMDGDLWSKSLCKQCFRPVAEAGDGDT